MKYIVTRWPTCPSMATQQATIKVHVNAVNHLAGLKEPGALISVNVLGGMNLRYQIDDVGKIIESARYGSEKENKLGGNVSGQHHTWFSTREVSCCF